MSYILRFEAAVCGEWHWVIGKYLVSYDPAPELGQYGYDGGAVGVTTNRQKARRFESKEEAIRVWRTQAPEPHHLRRDGKPCRPLTAFSVSIIPVEEPE